MENSNSEIVKNFLKDIYKKSSSKEINKLKKDIESIFFKNSKKYQKIIYGMKQISF